MPHIRYRESPCTPALNRVTGMPFAWSLNPYTGCSHRCAFCYVCAFERRGDRSLPADRESLSPHARRGGDRRGASLPREVDEGIRATVKELSRRHGIGDRRTIRLAPVPEVVPGEQLALGLSGAVSPGGACTE